MMKTNAKRKNSAVKKLIPAAGMLALSASMLATSTYAWFTMNTTVTITGMQMHTTVGSNLLIADSNTESAFKTSTSQTVTGTLEPVSTVDGVNYFYTLAAGADGKRLNTETTYNDLTEPGNADSSFNTAYNTTGAFGYVDYTFYLKATSTLSGGEKVAMTKCNLYKTVESTKTAVTDYAWRVAMFAEPVSAGVAGAAAGTSPSELKTVLGLSGASYFTATDKAVSAASGDDQLAQVTTFGTAANVGTTISQGNTQYYKVVVRLWLEGEDASCKNATYAPLASIPYNLDLRFDLVGASDSTHAVTAISSETTWDPTAAQSALS